MRFSLLHSAAGVAQRRSPLQFALWALLGFGVLQLLFFSLLVGGALVPDKPVVDHLAVDVKNGTYGPTGILDRMGGRADSFTECVVVGTGIGLPDANPVRKAALMPRLSNCTLGAKQIKQIAAGQDIPVDSYYFRYWAGYTPITRPALALFGMTGLRVIIGAFLVGAIWFAVDSIRRVLGGIAGLGLLGPLLLSSNLMSTPTGSLSQALAQSVSLVSVGICARAAARSTRWGLAAVALSGALFCYVDLLTTPAIPWAFSASVVAAVTYARTRGLRPTLLAVLGAGAIWPVAFAVTWVSRWLFAVPFAGWHAVLTEVQESVLFRTDGEYTGVDNALGAATMHNVRYWFDHITTARAVLVLVAVVVVVGLLRIARGGLGPLAATALVGLPAAVVPFWYEALRSHSQIHMFFVYKSVPAALGVLVFAVLSVLYLRSGPRRQRGGADPRDRVGRGPLLGRAECVSDVAGQPRSSGTTADSNSSMPERS